MLTPTIPSSLRETVEVPAITFASERYSELECAVLCHLAEEVGRATVPFSLNIKVKEELKATREWSAVDILDDLVTFE
jgi:hypothetical protein